MGSLPFLIIITTIVIIIHRPSSVHGNQQYIMCNTNFTCGDIPDLGYPFWGSGRPNYCGFPGFELNCSTGDNQSPEINIGNLTYKVDSIDNSSNLLTLSRTDYESDLCPTSLKNTTLVDTLFTLASDTEPLYLYYGCSQLNMTTLLPFQFTCDIIGPTSTSFYLSGNTSSLTSTTLSFYQLLVEGCASSVYIPVSPSRSVQMMANPNADNVVSAIREGFGLIWNANNGLCEACRVSGGLCGYDTENNRFNCHCPDQTYLTTCQGIRARTSESPSQGKAATASQQPLAMTISSPPLSFILLAIFISSSTMHPLILFFAFSALQTTSFATSSDAILTNCAYRNFSCGSLQNVSYPFTGGGLPDYCGPPDFLLKCVDGSVPELTIDSLSYRVLHLHQTGRTISLARSDLYDTGCTTQFKNTTLDKSSFDASSGNEILTLFYGCTPFMTFPLNISFSCGLGGEVREDVYFLIGTVPSGLDLSSVDCKERISLPILRSSVEKLVFNQSRVLEVLRDGFNVSYRNPYEAHCEKCRESHGRCGFDQESIKPICICGDRLCPGGNSKKISVGLGIGIGGVGVIFILLGFWLFLVIRRRKRKVPLSESKDISELPSGKSLPTTTTNFSQSIPSYPFLKSDLEKGSTYFGVQVFSYTELEKATDNFDSSKELGEGGFGVVYYGVLNDGRVVAVKRLYESSVKRVEQFMNEVEILAHLRHKNLVTLYGCTSKHSRDLLLVYEYIPNGTVADHLLGKQTNSGLLTWPVRLSIAIETAEALTYLHELEVIHRDVKTNNILLDNNFHVKVADFGLSRLFPTNVTHVSTAPQGTPGYVDPEYYQCFHLTDKSDVYSFGVVLIELISSLPAVDTNRHRHDINLANMAINKIQNHALHELVDPCLGFEKDSVVRRMITSVAELAFRCLQRERDMRPSMEEVRGILRGIENQSFGGQKAEVVDIGVDDVGLLNNSTPLSPDSIVADKWVSSSTTTNSF